MSRKAFRLGCLSGGSLYFFAMGDFASHEAAVRHFDGQPRHAREQAVTIETVPRVRQGVEYGHAYTIRDFSGEELNG